jgi:hypothetical protein
MPCSVSARGSAFALERGHRRMERGVETGDLRQLGRDRGDRANRIDMMRLVQRRERRQRCDRLQHARIDPHRRGEVRAAVHDAVADAVERRLAPDVIGEPRVQRFDRRMMAGACDRAIGEQHAVRIDHGETRRDVQAVDLPMRRRRATGRHACRTPKISGSTSLRSGPAPDAASPPPSP